MSELELKPCPFCGNDGNGPIEEALHIMFIEFTEPFRKGSAWSVQCDKCTATMGYFDSEDEAVDAWNTRVPVTVQDAAKMLLDWWHQPEPDPCAFVAEAKRVMGVMSALSEHSDDGFAAFDAALRAITESKG